MTDQEILQKQAAMSNVEWLRYFAEIQRLLLGRDSPLCNVTKAHIDRLEAIADELEKK